MMARVSGFCGVNYGAKNYTSSAGELPFMASEPYEEENEEGRMGSVHISGDTRK